MKERRKPGGARPGTSLPERRDEEKVVEKPQGPVPARDASGVETWEVPPDRTGPPIRLGQRVDDAAVRGYLALGSLGLFAATVAWAFWQVGGPNWTAAKDLLQLVLPIETGLLGSTTAYYFASRK
jgi:hypothetical protein